MESLEKTVIDYIDNQTANYAILINGKWGSGKTFFWNKRLSRVIESKGKNAIYISLYGIKSIEELQRNLFLSTNPVLKKKESAIDLSTQLAKIALNTASFFGNALDKYEISIEPFLNIKDNFVLCFDDLERTSLNLSELFGFINILVEHESIKTIFIAAENELDQNEEYHKIKEKLIGKTISFIADSDTIVHQLIAPYRMIDDNYFKFLDQNLRFINEVFNKMEDRNLRTLNHAIADYFLIYKKLRDMGQAYLDYWAKRMLHFILALMSVVRAGKVKKDEALKIDSGSYFLAGFENEAPEKPFIMRFVNTYYKGLTENFTWSPTITEYIYTGYLDNERFLEETKLTDEGELTPVKKLTTKFEELSQEEFSSCTQTVLREIKEGIYDINSIPRIYSFFELFSQERLIDMRIPTLKRIFIQGIDNSIRVTEPKIEFEIHYHKRSASSQTYTQILDYAEKTYKEYKEKQIKSIVHEHLKRASYDPEGLFLLIRQKNNPKYGLDYSPIFKHVSAAQFVQLVTTLSQENLIALRSSILERYNFSNIKDYFAEDLPVLIKVSTKLFKKINGKKMTIRNYTIKKLIEVIENVESRLTK
ncbi:P-loop NTPase fold protein [Paenibacillus antri]|nr:P-loop NTPase fold protein [Paenibacillus antri]